MAPLKALSVCTHDLPCTAAGRDNGGGGRAGYEALLFIHGFNSDIDGVLRLVGQLLSLGSFPPTIMATIFGWPCTNNLAYPMVPPALLFGMLCRAEQQTRGGR